MPLTYFMEITGPFGPFLAFAAGLVSVVSPCVLPLVPAYISHLMGSTGQGGEAVLYRNSAFRHALSFVLGFSVVFIVLGASLGVVGYVLRDQQILLRHLAGAALMFFGLNLAGIIRIPFLYRTYQANLPVGNQVGYARSFMVGAAFSIGWTPCVGPLLGSILALAATSSAVWQGAYLLLFYSLGLSLPFLAAGLAVGSVHQYIKAINRYLPHIEFAGGLVMVLFGFLIYTGRLIALNQYFDVFGVGSGI